VKHSILPAKHLVQFAVALLASAGATHTGARAQSPDAAEIIRQSFEQDERNDKIARQYTFQQRVEERDLSKQGNIKSSRSKTHDVTLLDGSEYERLIARDDQPLSPKEEAKEQRKLDKSIQKVQNETPKQRAKRLAARDKRKQEQRKWIAEIQNTFDFQLRGEETVDGIDTYVIDARPKPGYKAGFRKARFLAKMQGTFWISKADRSWVRLEAETLDKISFGWVLFRLGKGSVVEFHQTKVNDEVWLLDSSRVRFNGRVALLKGLNREILGSYSEFRKFSAESNVVFADPVK
jgi:hypothetical protein